MSTYRAAAVRAGIDEAAALRERGRRLASERDDLIASGVDPADLAVPIAPDDPEEGR